MGTGVWRESEVWGFGLGNVRGCGNVIGETKIRQVTIGIGSCIQVVIVSNFSSDVM